MVEIVVTPTMKFRIQGEGKNAKKLQNDFKESRSQGLLLLVKQSALSNVSPSLSFWYDFASSFMKSFCVFSDVDPLHVPIEKSLLRKHIQLLPPMLGAENITEDMLEEVWRDLEQYLISVIDEFKGNPRQFIAREFPDWAEVGRVHFHLAENKNPNGKPFVFLSTYSVRVAGKARVQHRPLGVALKESLRQKSNKHLEQLLTPINLASKKSKFVRKAVSTSSIYAPLYLDPTEAFELIGDIPECEQAGVICKVPVWWQKSRPPRVKVSVKIGSQTKKSKVGFNQLLDFDVGISIGDKYLTKAELKKLMTSDGPLVELGGKWIEVDKEKIEGILHVWNDAIATAYSDGISFAEAMRMLSGFKLNSSESDLDELGDQDRNWLDIGAGSKFNKLLSELREPDKKHSKAIESLLNKYLKGHLRPYQKSGLSWLKIVTSLQLGGCLADDMGLGKTIQVLAMLLVQKHYFKTDQPSLLVVPASLLGNWQSELEKFSPDINYKIIHSSVLSANKVKIAPRNLNKYDLIITTYSMVLRIDWLQKKQWQVIIADEAQAIKNSKTKQSKAMRSLQASAKIAMTGTPVENSLGDLWSIFDFACPGLLGNESQFKKAIKVLKEPNEDGEVDYGPLRELIAPYILRRKKTDKSVISDLPDKIEMAASCYLSRKQATLYQKEVERLAKSLDDTDGIERKGLVLSSLMKFKQICNHPSQYLANDSYDPKLSGKFEKIKELAEIIASRGEKVLVFTQFRELTDILSHYLGGCFGHEGLVLHGGTPVKKRQGLVDQFQDPSGPSFFILSLKAGGTGLNLTEANHVIHFDRWWNPAVENQATDRAFRIGQKKNVVVHKFICKGTIEEKIDAMISEKQQLTDSLIEGSKELNLTELSNDELLDLVRFDISGLGDR